MATLDQDDLDAIQLLIDPTDAKIDTLASSVASLAGDIVDVASDVSAVKAVTDTLASRNIPLVHVNITGESTPPFNALHDAPALGAHWTSERIDYLYSNTEGTARAEVGGNVKGWRDQVNGWLATQIGADDGPAYVVEDNMPVVQFTGAAGQGLEIDAAGDGLFRNIPYAYVFVAHKYANQPTQQFVFSHATNNSNNFRVGCGLNNNGIRLWAKSEFDGGSSANAILNSEFESSHGVWSIGTYAFRWSDGAITVRRDLGTFDPDASLGASGNSSDTNASFRARIGSSLTTNYGNGIIGPIGEIVVCRPASALSSSQLDDIAGAMMEKWGVA